jgi:hypothetical protein
LLVSYILWKYYNPDNRLCIGKTERFLRLYIWYISVESEQQGKFEVRKIILAIQHE